MKIVIINHSDTRGGASVVSLRLLEALHAAGADVHMLTVHKASASPLVVKASPDWRAKIPFLAEHLRIFFSNGFNRADLFKVSTGSDGLPLDRHPLVADADAVILNWVNQGMLSLKAIRRMADAGKRIIWTMHDMWNLTGICHHAGSCDAFSITPGCGVCPFLHARQRPHDLSRKVWQQKKELYSHSRITFVAVSSWLAQKCQESSLMRSCRVEVIPNAFPVGEFSLTPSVSRKAIGLPEDKKIILMGAARIDDPVKGLPLAIDALNRLDAPDAVAVFFGAMRDAGALKDLRLPHFHFGPVTDAVTLRELYAHASVVLSSSLYETLPGTLIEGMAAGCFPVTFGRGGQADIVDHLTTGYIARYPDTADLAKGIRIGLDADPDTAIRLRKSVCDKFAADAVAEKYIRLLNT